MLPFFQRAYFGCREKGFKIKKKTKKNWGHFEELVEGMGGIRGAMRVVICRKNIRNLFIKGHFETLVEGE